MSPEPLWSPRMLGAHVLAILAITVAVLLGVWQYDAWGDRRAAERVDLTDDPPVALDDVLGPDDGFPGDAVGQPVSLAGRWLPEGTVLVDDREHDGDEGYWVVTPLLVGESALPVVRGWTPSPNDVPSVAGTTSLTGWLQPPDGTGAPDDDPTDDVYPELRTADLAQNVDVDLYGGYAVAQQPTAGLVAADLETLPSPGQFTALRNLLYALEWWVFGGFAGFVWSRFVRDTRRPQVSADRVASRA